MRKSLFGKEYFYKYRNHKLRSKFWKTFLNKNLNQNNGRPRILDVGCAYGFLLQELESSFETYGIEISKYAVDKARKIAKESKIYTANAENFYFKSNFFDAIFCLDTLEHLKIPEKCIKICSKIIKKNGLLIVSVPNLRSALKGFKGCDWFAYRDKTHVSLLPPEQWKSNLEKNHFKIIKIFSDGFFDPPYVSFLPAKFQRIIFLFPGWLQYKTKKIFIPSIGENIIIVAKKK